MYWIVGRVVDGTEKVTHLVYLPRDCQMNNVSLRWTQELHNTHVNNNNNIDDYYDDNSRNNNNDNNASAPTGCWALDNVLALDSENRPSSLEENFDPISPSNFLFFPGGQVQVRCCGNRFYIVVSKSLLADDTLMENLYSGRACYIIIKQ